MHPGMITAIGKTDRHAAMYDPLLLTTFIAVAQTRSFSKAARQLALGQSTVSEHVRRLEQQAQRRLFVRDTHSVVLTSDGNAMLSFAQTILDVNERARSYFAGSTMRERVRFGVTENFVTSHMSRLLSQFQAEYPMVDLELTVGLSGNLFNMLDSGRLDLILGKRLPGESRGRFVRKERMVWIGNSRTALDPVEPVPLVMFPPPSMSRAMAITALEQAGIPWRMVCTCDGLMGLRAYVMAGFGVLAQPQGMIPDGLTEMPPCDRLPEIGDIEFVLEGPSRCLSGSLAGLAEIILNG